MKIINDLIHGEVYTHRRYVTNHTSIFNLWTNSHQWSTVVNCNRLHDRFRTIYNIRDE